MKREEFSWWQRFLIRIDWPVYVGDETRLGWRGYLPFYAFKCRWHGIVKNYPQGYTKRLYCPECQEKPIK